MGISTAAVARGKFTTAFPLRALIAGTVSQITASWAALPRHADAAHEDSEQL